MTPHPPTSTLFPYTTLFRSLGLRRRRRHLEVLVVEVQLVEVQLVEVLVVAVELVLGRRGHRRCRPVARGPRSEEHTSELQSHVNLVCRLLLEKKKNTGQLRV